MVCMVASIRMRLLLVLPLAIAQDLFLSPRNGSAAVEVGNDSGPKLGASIGCGNNCDYGVNFDHWNQWAANGAISKICFVVSPYFPSVDSHQWIEGFTICYGGRCFTEGKGGGDCFPITSGEVITQVEGTADWGCIPTFCSHPAVSSITIKLNSGRWRKWGGHECSRTWTLTAPEGKHISAFYGRAKDPDDHTSLGYFAIVSSIGVYYDSNIGSGEWVDKGVPNTEVTLEYCTKASSSTVVEQGSSWSVGAQTEFSLGFKVKGFGSSVERSITRDLSKTITSKSHQSFESTKCETLTFTCSHGRAYQWVFKSNFDGFANAYTETNHWTCSEDVPCCLPLHFNSEEDASKGCKPNSPNIPFCST